MNNPSVEGPIGPFDDHTDQFSGSVDSAMSRPFGATGTAGTQLQGSTVDTGGQLNVISQINAGGQLAGSVQLKADQLNSISQINASSMSGGGQQQRLGLQNTKLVSTWFKMAGMDASTYGEWDTWVVPNSPDFVASLYVGPLNTPLRHVYIENVWQV